MSTLHKVKAYFGMAPLEDYEDEYYDDDRSSRGGYGRRGDSYDRGERYEADYDHDPRDRREPEYASAGYRGGYDEDPRYGRDLVAMGRDAVADWSQRWRLVNLVDARNTVAVRWLRRVGFDVGAGPGLVTFRLGARV